MTVRVLISDKMDPRAAAIFRERGIEVDEKPGLSPDELKAIIGDYDGLAIRSATKVTKAILEAATNLKVVGRAGIGVDNVDIPAATARGVVVMNTPFGNSITTAEHAIALMFALARQLPEADASTQAGKWEKNRFMGVEVTGKTLGLIGCGNIGSIVATRALGLKMKVVAFDPFLTPERAVELGVEKVELDELLKRADFITLHTPLTDQTRNILSRENLAKTKKGVRIINCARGGLIDEAALKDALESGHVAGAALDVFESEPATASPLFGTPGFISTPAPRRIDQRGAGQCRDPGRRADERFPAARRGHQRDQHAVADGRGSAAAEALHGAGREAREAGRADPRRGRPLGLGRGRGRRGAAQPEADHRRGAGRADGHLFADREHGQRALPGEGTRARRARGPARPRGRLSHAGRGRDRDVEGHASGLPAPCSATGRRGWSSCSESRSRPSCRAR